MVLRIIFGSSEILTCKATPSRTRNDTSYDLTTTDRTNLANAFKVYRLDKRIDEAFYNTGDLTTINMVATPVSAFGVVGTSAELKVTSQS